MKLTARKINIFNLFNLPAAYITGVRTKYIDDESCTVTVKHRWINQNPFRSMFWAVQGMAAELTTGALVMKKIKESDRQISMLVLNNNANFSKKATGRITFRCEDGKLVDEAIARAIETGDGQTVWMSAIGKNSEGIKVSKFNFEWTLKVKKLKDRN
ncbi:MAG: DUF4442 domain-containing protein [Bacteroidia bacterium]|nr:DUF4442 domain-containing protein [Bacteroidia bacterium]MBT8311155.1 DUF4442 domain-containing protein [Bacteroidia bacterium]NND09977.1 DUF4442 domain-containing protein [Flavobacteriaceae bacterium]NNK27895.1 DUF4442 domain-containing protein [Flavobacteriaceae bacterium]NNL61719.1 DUF4442 domain-containing protein [Flavobacteriaceae bacterium]